MGYSSGIQAVGLVEEGAFGSEVNIPSFITDPVPIPHAAPYKGYVRRIETAYLPWTMLLQSTLGFFSTNISFDLMLTRSGLLVYTTPLQAVLPEKTGGAFVSGVISADLTNPISLLAGQQLAWQLGVNVNDNATLTRCKFGLGYRHQEGKEAEWFQRAANSILGFEDES